MAPSACVKKCMKSKSRTTKPKSRTVTKSTKSRTVTKSSKSKSSKSKSSKSKSSKSKSTKKCTLPAKRYIVLKCAKVSSKKPISSQGKVITMKCTSASAAGKFATAMYKKTHRQMKSVYLYRKGKVTKFSITFKVSKTTGKKVAKAKSVRKTDVKYAKKSSPCRKSKKSLTKRCSNGSRKSKNNKVCLRRLGKSSKSAGIPVLSGLLSVFSGKTDAEKEKEAHLARVEASRAAGIAMRAAAPAKAAAMAERQAHLARVEESRAAGIAMRAAAADKQAHLARVEASRAAGIAMRASAAAKDKEMADKKAHLARVEASRAAGFAMRAAAVEKDRVFAENLASKEGPGIIGSIFGTSTNPNN